MREAGLGAGVLVPSDGGAGVPVAAPEQAATRPASRRTDRTVEWGSRRLIMAPGRRTGACGFAARPRQSQSEMAMGP